jgi:hypothetical protein
MRMNCRQAKDASMAIRKARLERSTLSFDDKALLENISDRITGAIENHRDCVTIDIGSQLQPTMSHRLVELIKDHCKANEYVVTVSEHFLDDRRYLTISGW